jgi:hypothetical protein
VAATLPVLYTVFKTVSSPDKSGFRFAQYSVFYIQYVAGSLGVDAAADRFLDSSFRWNDKDGGNWV